MQATGRPYPVYVVLTPFREIAPSVRVLFRTLTKLQPYLPYAEGYYRSDCDEALLGLQFERDAAERLGVSKLLEMVGRCNLPLIAPERLDLAQRISFFHDHLPIYDTYVQQYRSPDPAESLLERVIAALEEHVASLPDDDHYESVEVSTDESHPATSRMGRASSQWEMDYNGGPDRRA